MGCAAGEGEVIPFPSCRRCTALYRRFITLPYYSLQSPLYPRTSIAIESRRPWETRLKRPLPRCLSVRMSGRGATWNHEGVSQSQERASPRRRDRTRVTEVCASSVLLPCLVEGLPHTTNREKHPGKFTGEADDVPIAFLPIVRRRGWWVIPFPEVQRCIAQAVRATSGPSPLLLRRPLLRQSLCFRDLGRSHLGRNGMTSNCGIAIFWMVRPRDRNGEPHIGKNFILRHSLP